MTEATLAEYVTKVLKACEGKPEATILKTMEATEKKSPALKGLVDYYKAQKNGNSEPAPPKVTVTTKPEEFEVPSAVHEQLAKISAKFDTPMFELEVQWKENFDAAEMDDLGLEGEAREQEAWMWIMLTLTHENTQAKASDWTFTLLHVDPEVGHYNKWVKKEGSTTPKIRYRCQLNSVLPLVCLRERNLMANLKLSLDHSPPSQINLLIV